LLKKGLILGSAGKGTKESGQNQKIETIEADKTSLS
jgi:hypothetical protein